MGNVGPVSNFTISIFFTKGPPLTLPGGVGPPNRRSMPTGPPGPPLFWPGNKIPTPVTRFQWALWTLIQQCTHSILSVPVFQDVHVTLQLSISPQKHVLIKLQDYAGHTLVTVKSMKGMNFQTNWSIVLTHSINHLSSANHFFSKNPSWPLLNKFIGMMFGFNQVSIVWSD